MEKIVIKKNGNSTVILILIALFFAIMLLGSCGTSKRNSRVIYQTKIDSVFVKQTERVEVRTKDTLVKFKYDSVQVHDTIYNSKDCPNISDKLIERYSKTGNTKLTLNVKNGVLNAKCESDSLEQLITNLREIVRYQDNEIFKSKFSDKVDVKIVEKPVVKIKLKVPWWAWVCLLYTLASFFYIFRFPVGKLIFKIIKYFN
jgi:hypothetical protein